MRRGTCGRCFRTDITLTGRGTVDPHTVPLGDWGALQLCDGTDTAPVALSRSSQLADLATYVTAWLAVLALLAGLIVIARFTVVALP